MKRLSSSISKSKRNLKKVLDLDNFIIYPIKISTEIEQVLTAIGNDCDLCIDLDLTVHDRYLLFYLF